MVSKFLRLGWQTEGELTHPRPAGLILARYPPAVLLLLLHHSLWIFIRLHASSKATKLHHTPSSPDHLSAQWYALTRRSGAFKLWFLSLYTRVILRKKKMLRALIDPSLAIYPRLAGYVLWICHLMNSDFLLGIFLQTFVHFHRSPIALFASRPSLPKDTSRLPLVYTQR